MAVKNQAAGRTIPAVFGFKDVSDKTIVRGRVFHHLIQATQKRRMDEIFDKRQF
jgi:hypothetical protein